jgi:hypothetical protein
MQKGWMAGSIALGIALGGLLAAHPVEAESTKKQQVDRVTCEEFLALDPQNQQRIAYWVDGYQIAKGESNVGTVAFDKFERPMAMLVDDCRATPKATLWQKVKSHL